MVANKNPGCFSPFVIEQMEALQKQGVEIIPFGVVGKGALGYLKNLGRLKRSIRLEKPDIIHSYYGLCGVLANLQRRVPVITTYLGSDVHQGGWLLALSRLAMRLSAHNIFVTKESHALSGYKKKNFTVAPFGLCLNVFSSVSRESARAALGFGADEKLALFSGSFDNAIKNYPLAKEAVEMVPELKLLEFKGYSREDAALLLNACNLQLTTSIRESGPLVVKEAMACGTPVVSVDVGDVKEVTAGVDGCYIAVRSASDLAEKIKLALAFEGKTSGRERIIELGLSNDVIAKKIVKVYDEVLK